MILSDWELLRWNGDHRDDNEEIPTDQNDDHHDGPDITTSNENSVIIIEIIFFTDTCLSKMFSIMPRHNYCLSRLEVRPNCERTQVFHPTLSSIEGNQLGKCFHKTPSRPPETPGPDVIPLIVSKLWWDSQHVMGHSIIRLYWFNINTFNKQSVTTFLSNKQHIIDFTAGPGPGGCILPSEPLVTGIQDYCLRSGENQDICERRDAAMAMRGC